MDEVKKCHFCGSIQQPEKSEKLGLTTKQHRLKTTIERFMEENGYAPTQRTLSELTNTTLSGVNAMLDELEKKNHIKRNYYQNQSIRIIK